MLPKDATVLQKTVLSLDVSDIQQTVLLLDVSVLQQPVIALDVSVIQKSVLSQDVSVLQLPVLTFDRSVIMQSLLPQPVLALDVYVISICAAPGRVCSKAAFPGLGHVCHTVICAAPLKLSVRQQSACADPGGVWPTAACAAPGRVCLQERVLHLCMLMQLSLQFIFENYEIFFCMRCTHGFGSGSSLFWKLDPDPH